MTRIREEEECSKWANYSLNVEVLLNDSLQSQHEISELRETFAVLQQRAVSWWRITTATETDPHHKRRHRLKHQPPLPQLIVEDINEQV